MDKTILQLLNSIQEMNEVERLKLVSLIHEYCEQLNDNNSSKVLAKILFEMVLLSNVENKKSFSN